MNELRTVLERGVSDVGDVPFEAVAERARRIRARSQARRFAAALLLVVAAAAGSLVAITRGGEDTAPVVADAGTVPLPPRGDVAPEWLPDGSPVFVAHHDDGSVQVFAAFSTHVPGFKKPIGWCERARQFEDWEHGSWWDGHGRKIDGPAPSDLWEYDVVGLDADSVRVGHLRRSNVLSQAERVALPCGRREANVVHDYDALPAHDLASVVEEQPSGMVLITGTRVALSGDGARVCDVRSSRCSRVRHSPSFDGDESWVTRVLARVDGTDLYDVRVLDGWQQDHRLVSCSDAVASVAQASAIVGETPKLAARLTSYGAYAHMAYPNGSVASPFASDHPVWVVSVAGEFKPSFGRGDRDVYPWGVLMLDGYTGQVWASHASEDVSDLERYQTREC